MPSSLSLPCALMAGSPAATMAISCVDAEPPAAPRWRASTACPASSAAAPGCPSACCSTSAVTPPVMSADSSQPSAWSPQSSTIPIVDPDSYWYSNHTRIVSVLNLMSNPHVAVAGRGSMHDVAVRSSSCAETTDATPAHRTTAVIFSQVQKHTVCCFTGLTATVCASAARRLPPSPTSAAAAATDDASAGLSDDVRREVAVAGGADGFFTWTAVSFMALSCSYKQFPNLMALKY